MGIDDPFRYARKKPRPKRRHNRTVLTRENECLLSIARPAKLQLINYRDDRGFISLTNAIEDAVSKVRQLEGLILTLKEIFDLAVNEKDVKYLIYGFNKDLTLDQQILFKELLRRKRDGKL